MQLFGTSGIRRVADKDLIQLALNVGLAVGKVYASIVVGCDTRTSSQAMKHALVSGLLFAGSRCSDAGVVPLPTLAYTAREFDAGALPSGRLWGIIRPNNPTGSKRAIPSSAKLVMLRIKLI